MCFILLEECQELALTSSSINIKPLFSSRIKQSAGLSSFEILMPQSFCGLTFCLPLSRLGIAQASLALLSLLHRFCGFCVTYK